PIPAFTNADGEILMTERSVLAVAEKIREKGSNLWFHAEAAELLESYKPEKDPDAPKWAKENWKPSALKKGKDIFDVWFESGVSWHSVIEKGEQGRADLYLEGSDQHRGWFQSSLLTSLGATGKPPFRHILTHGFIVDALGKKMSKSGGNALEVEKILEQYGADVCRWWVASLNYSKDVKADIKIIEAATDEYRTIRNTIRFLLNNLNDFDPEKDRVEVEGDEYFVNNIALGELRKMIGRIEMSTTVSFDYKGMSRGILSFCDQFLSKHYIEAVRDRLYCERPDRKERRKTQTVMYDVADALIKLCAPILVHTAEEAYKSLPGKEKTESVHMTSFPEGGGKIVETNKEVKIMDEWSETVLPFKEKCLIQLERAKEEGKPSNPLDAEIRANRGSYDTFFSKELADLIGVSRVTFEDGDIDISVTDLTDQPKCNRCWKRAETAKIRSDGGTLCDRCADAVGV
ncbi:MAG: class I tRNA ligase family protein, partial [Candidatus Dadabacteria bacterium]|nr:class I tRNA ligase family protein [Candidatus Dadabacteria bacterium]